MTLKRIPFPSTKSLPSLEISHVLRMSEDACLSACGWDAQLQPSTLGHTNFWAMLIQMLTFHVNSFNAFVSTFSYVSS